MNSNFDRSLSSEDVLRRRASLLQRLHIDGWLLLILLMLASSSLFILYSASGKNLDLLLKQAGSFGIGLTGMFIIAQIDPRLMARWVPLAYLGGLGLLLAVVWLVLWCDPAQRLAVLGGLAVACALAGALSAWRWQVMAASTPPFLQATLAELARDHAALTDRGAT